VAYAQVFGEEADLPEAVILRKEKMTRKISSDVSEKKEAGSDLDKKT
jgi:hypothetical protein